MSVLAESPCSQLQQDSAFFWKHLLPLAGPEYTKNVMGLETRRHNLIVESQGISMVHQANGSTCLPHPSHSPEMSPWKTLDTYEHTKRPKHECFNMWDCHEREINNLEHVAMNTCLTSLNSKHIKRQWLDNSGKQNTGVSLLEGEARSSETLCTEEGHAHPFQEVELPTIDDCILLAQKCKNLKQSEPAKRLHLHIHLAGFESAIPALGNHLMQMFIECGNISDAQQVFSRMAFPDESSWTSLMQGHIENGQFEHAFYIFQNMQEDGILPTRHTFLALLKACTGLKNRRKGQRLHSQMIEDGFEDDSYLFNSLVVMYVKCGLLDEAQSLFDDFIISDAVSWNALIAGYAEQGYSDEALRMLDKMHVEGIPSNAITCLGVLQACGDLQALSKGQEIHADMVKKGHEMDKFLSSSLVDMYAKCGSLVEALNVFDGLLNRGIVLWTALIAGYAEHGYGEEALSCWSRMQSEGVTPNAVTYVFGLKACIKLQALSKGMELHDELIRGAFENDTFVKNTLVDMYAKCGSIVEAQLVFDASTDQDVVSWNIILSGFAQHGLYKKVLDSWDEMQKGNVLPNDNTYVCILKACGNMGSIKHGQEAYMEIIKLGFESQPFLGSSLVDLYTNCVLPEAQKVFDNLNNQDVVAWNALIAGYSDHGYGEKALSCLRQMGLDGVFPDHVTFIMSLKACSSIGSILTGLTLHKDIVLRGFDNDSFVGNCLVDMYAGFGLFAEAWKLAVDSPIASIISLNSLLTGYCKFGLYEEALTCAEDVHFQGVLPNAVTYVCVLNACANINTIEKGLSTHTAIVKENIEDVYVGCALVDMYAKVGLLAEAQKVFDELKDRDVVLWSALIAGYALWGLDDVAKSCVQQMQSENVVPNVISWNGVLSNYSEEGENERALSAYALMQEQGVLPNGVTFLNILSACSSKSDLKVGQVIHAHICGLKDEVNQDALAIGLIDMYGKCGDMAVAQKVFDDMLEWDLTSWTALVAGYARQGKAKSVLSLLEKMEDKGVQPNGVTFLRVLSACSHAGSVEMGQFYFDVMSRKYNINPSIEHYVCIIDLLARAGQLNEAVTIIERIPSVPNTAIWTALLGACRKWGNGREFFESALKEGNKQVLAFIVMSKLYPEISSWEDAANLELGSTTSFIPEKG